MAEEVRIWAIQPGEVLQPVPTAKLDLETRLESWIARDPSILGPDLLLIGRQVETAYGGFIDLLALDRDADVVLIELKRNQTPREVTAQALDYASWIRELSSETIIEIANQFLGDQGPLDVAFGRQFGTDLPDAVNQNHAILIVASNIDDSTERIIRYLSDEHGASINAATFHYFKAPDGNEFLARLFLVEPEVVEAQARLRSSSKRRPNLTYEQLSQIAAENGIQGIYEDLVSSLSKLLSRHTTISSIAFTGDFDGSRRTVIGLFPGRSSAASGLYFQVYSHRLADLIGLQPLELEASLPANHADWRYSPAADDDHSGYDGSFATPEEAQEFAGAITRLTPA